jgi:hypothetical protein
MLAGPDAITAGGTATLGAGMVDAVGSGGGGSRASVANAEDFDASNGALAGVVVGRLLVKLIIRIAVLVVVVDVVFVMVVEVCVDVAVVVVVRVRVVVVVVPDVVVVVVVVTVRVTVWVVVGKYLFKSMCNVEHVAPDGAWKLAGGGSPASAQHFIY